MGKTLLRELVFKLNSTQEMELKVRGTFVGETGTHSSFYDSDGMHCSCQGFMTHQKCKHTDLLKDVAEAIRKKWE